jgi:branched-chain amino acid transport system ATP-binding protein
VLERLAELTTVLLVEQNLRVVRAIARDAVVLDQGRVVHAGDAGELVAQPELVKRLLGVGSA